jgi:omega-amidase
MKIVLFQPDIHWQDIERNLAKYQKLFDRYGHKNDLIILPEMFTTGFSMNCQELAEPMNGLTHQFLISSAKKYNCTITGSIIITEGQRCYNRLLWVGPNEATFIYDKRHLFSMGFEDKNYTPGNARLVINKNHVKWLPLICYDLRFPVWSRNKEHYDALIYVSNWPGVRQDTWDILLKARAIENQCYVFGVNRVGKDGNGVEYIGGSQMIDARGNVLGKLANEEGVLEVEMDMDDLHAFRKKFRVLNDADQFSIHY